MGVSCEEVHWHGKSRTDACSLVSRPVVFEVIGGDGCTSVCVAKGTITLKPRESTSET